MTGAVGVTQIFKYVGGKIKEAKGEIGAPVNRVIPLFKALCAAPHIGPQLGFRKK